VDGASGDEVPDDAAVPGPDARDPLRFSDWMKRSATAAVMTGIARGLHQALEVERQVPAFVMEVPGEPEDDGPIDLRFDPDDPTKTVAVIRERRPEAARPTEGRDQP